MDKIQLMVEAERRGILPADKAVLLNEARKRGLVKADKPAAFTPAPTGTLADQIPTDPELNIAKPNKSPTAFQNLVGDIATVAGPSIETAGAIGGGLVGAGTMLPTGPGAMVGGAVGSGIGYAAGKNIVNMMNQYAGRQEAPTWQNALTQPVMDVYEGAAYEMAGLPIAKTAGWLGSKIVNLKNVPKQRAARIAREALGPDLPLAKEVLRNAPGDITAGQAAADITNPAFQSLVEQSLKRDPRFLARLTEEQRLGALNRLADIAGATTETGARSVQQAARGALGETLEPAKQMALTRANMGQDVARFEQQAGQLGEQAADAVQDVRRFTDAAGRARGTAVYRPEGMPKAPYQYTYMGELAKRAEDVAEQAARGSLDFGQAARSNETVAQALRDRGIEPLTPDSIIGQLRSTMSRPEYAGNRDVSTVLRRVAEDIGQWTDNGGVVDAVALDAIRKNSVNAAIRDLYPQADNKVQKELAAKLLTQVRPAIVSAIEKAGGIGYRDYLKAYEKGAQAISQKKLGAEAMRLFQENPKEFVRLVEGNAPDVVEKTFGPGSYDIVKEMAADSMASLRQVAGTVKRDARVAEQAAAGRDALKEIMQANSSKFRFPGLLSAKITTANAALDRIQERVGKKTMAVLTEAMKSGKSAAELLDTLPASERSKILNILRNPQVYLEPGTSAAVGTQTINKLSEEEPRQPANALVR